MSQALQNWIESHRSVLLQRLVDFVSIPSISTDPAAKPDIRRCAEWLAGWGRSQGLAAEILETPGHPAVLIETPPVPGKPILLIYGHYDVQPAEDLELWTSPPFSPRIDGDRMYGRGVSDNKGQILVHLTAIQALRELVGELPLQVKVLIEGEEEIGSVHLPKLLDDLACIRGAAAAEHGCRPIWCWSATPARWSRACPPSTTAFAA